MTERLRRLDDDGLGRALAAVGADLDWPASPDLATRVDRLARLAAMTRRHAQDIIDAASADFGSRSAHETLIADLLAVDESIRHARRHLRRWMSAKRIATDIKYRPGYNRLIPQPLGVVGVVAPWNYPYQLSMLPAVGVIFLLKLIVWKSVTPIPPPPEKSALIVEISEYSSTRTWP